MSAGLRRGALFGGRHLVLAVVVVVCAARIVHAQPPADAVGAAIEDTLGSWRVLQRLIDADAVNDSRTGGSPITSAVNAWLSVSVASKLAAYSFPVQVGVSPFLSTGASTWLRKSEFTASYGITSLKQTPVDVGGGQQANRVRASTPTTVKLTYTVPITSTDQKVSATDLQSTLASFASSSTTFDLDTVAASPDVRTFVERKKQDFLRAFNSSFEADYTYAWGDKTQDEIDLSGNAETGFSVGSRTLTINGSITSSLFPARDTLAAYHAFGATGGLKIPVTVGIVAKVSVSGLHYGGDSFTGIPGVLDTSYPNDWTITESAAFPIVGGQSITLTVQEVHLGSGSADVSIGTKFGFKFGGTKK